MHYSFITCAYTHRKLDIKLQSASSSYARISLSSFILNRLSRLVYCYMMMALIVIEKGALNIL